MNILDKLISIVLPVYNGAEFLNQSIDSIIRQTYTNWELLVLDDCSTDNTPNIVKEYVKKDSRIHYYRNEQNLKLPGNLNKGFSLSKGDYLTWTSDDNMFHDNALEVMYKTITSQKVDLVYASYNIIDEKGNVVIPFGDLYEVDYDETYQGEEIKAMSAVAGKLYIVTEKTRDDLLNLHIF